ncbi:hypothetical protein BH23THE1_BH23THE1_21920 [soil metagenome]
MKENEFINNGSIENLMKKDVKINRILYSIISSTFNAIYK